MGRTSRARRFRAADNCEIEDVNDSATEGNIAEIKDWRGFPDDWRQAV